MQLTWYPRKITWNWKNLKSKFLNGHKLQSTTCCELNLWKIGGKPMKIGATLPRIHWCNHRWESVTNQKMFHSLSNRKATESALVRDKELCRHNRVISSQVRYVSGIRISVANTKTNGSHNQKQRNKILAQSQSYEKNSQNYDTFRQV